MLIRLLIAINRIPSEYASGMAAFSCLRHAAHSAHGSSTSIGSGVLTAFNPSSGKVLEHVSLGAPATRFIAPSAAGGRLFVADGNRIVAFAMH